MRWRNPLSRALAGNQGEGSRSAPTPSLAGSARQSGDALLRRGPCTRWRNRSVSVRWPSRRRCWVRIDPVVAGALNNLAVLHCVQGQSWKGAAAPRARTGDPRADARSRPSDVATSLTNLANLYRVQGQYARAEPLHTRALAIREQALGHDDPVVASSAQQSCDPSLRAGSVCAGAAAPRAH